MIDNRPIGLFDSGVGGLSVLKEVKKILPFESFIFFADQKNNPYGKKNKKELIDLTTNITRFLIEKNIKALVVACNTATCYVLPHLRKSFNIPIIGVVPAVKPATKLTKNGRIVVMSTPATAKSEYLSQLIKKNAKEFKVLKIGCADLEEAVEYLERKKISKLLDKYVSIIKKFQADVIVLGCTHFPFLKLDIKKRVGKRTVIIDSGEAIARRVRTLLKENKSLSAKKSSDLYFTTGDEQIFSKVASKLLKYNIQASSIRI